MGIKYKLRCVNPSCNYEAEIINGLGMIKAYENSVLENDIISGKKKAPAKIIELLNRGCTLKSNGTFLCPNCREWINVAEQYVAVRNDGMTECELYWVGEEPKCSICGGRLEYVSESISPETPCPKCETKGMLLTSLKCFD